MPTILRHEQVRDAIPELADLIQRTADCRLVRIEGLTGVGKTTLARALADRISAVVFHGDDLIERRKTGEPYRDVVRFDQLQAAITNALSCGAMVVIETVCLDEIAPEQSIGRGYRVYIKRRLVQQSGCTTLAWVRRSHSCPDQRAGTLAASLPRSFPPHEKADLVIEVPEPGHTLSGPKVVR